MNNDTTIAIVDDHSMFRKGLMALINLFSNYKVILEASNGKDLIKKLDQNSLPEIILMDIDMPEMNGYETCEWLRTNYSDIKVLALSTMDADTAIIKMIRHGAKGYLLKDSDPDELKKAFSEVLSLGYYYNDHVTRKIIRSINQLVDETSNIHTNNTITAREMEFLRHACSEKSYKEIADEMYLSERTIDGYRESLFKKCSVNTRVGLVIYAIKNNLVMP
jgi:DNA-binding NarL/FixJ family response regulator